MTNGDGADRLCALYEQHGRSVLAFATRRTRLLADAEDVLAETFLVAWRRIGDVPIEHALPWLYGVAARVMANQRRGAHRHALLVDKLKCAEVVRDGARTPAVTDEIEVALLSLRALHQEVLRLEAWGALGPAEIARTLSISPNAASLRLHRARLALKQAVETLEKRERRVSEAENS